MLLPVGCIAYFIRCTRARHTPERAWNTPERARNTPERAQKMPERAQNTSARSESNELATARQGCFCPLRQRKEKLALEKVLVPLKGEKLRIFMISCPLALRIKAQFARFVYVRTLRSATCALKYSRAHYECIASL